MFFFQRLMLVFSLSLLLVLSAHAATELTIPYSEPLQDKPYSAINVELGEYDVTQFALFGPAEVSLKIDTPLANGNYTVAVKVFYEDGEIQTLAEQTLDIQQQGVDSWQYNTMLKAGYRIDEDDVQDYSNSAREYHNAALQGSLHANAGTWQISSSAYAVYDSNDAASEDSWQLPGYQVEALHQGDYGETRIGAGTVMMGDNNLLFSNYQRRGIKIGSKMANGLTEFDLFGTVTDITNSPDEQLMPKGDSDQETLGGVVRVAPLTASREKLLLGVGYVDGTGSAGGAGFSLADPETLYGGKSWNVSVDSFWLDNALRFYAEYAKSDFDSDGIGLGEDATTDSARQFMLQLSASPLLPDLGLQQWDMTLLQQTVGREYYSIANLAMAGDISSSSLLFNGRQPSWGFSTELSRQTNNVDDDPTRATQQIDYAALDMDFTPQVDQQQSAWQWLGSPSVSAYLHLTDTTQDEGDAELTGTDVDQLNQDLSLTTQFSKATMSWGLGYSQTDVDDRSDAVEQNGQLTYTPMADNTTRMVSVFASWYPSVAVNVSPSLQWLDYSEDGTDNNNQTLNANLDAQFQLIADRLFLNMNYSISEMDAEYDDPLTDKTKNSSHSGNAELLWKPLIARNNRPGVDLFLNGSFARDTDDNTDLLTNKAWQWNLGFVVTFAGNKLQ